mmetsp:Transcript_10054/g.35220  ORF Transcript_10054/g.35220 Transcript_10054/m.35220 type:complete len:1011 (-) Transcript_10054:133-3165(-)
MVIPSCVDGAVVVHVGARNPVARRVVAVRREHVEIRVAKSRRQRDLDVRVAGLYKENVLLADALVHCTRLWHAIHKLYRTHVMQVGHDRETGGRVAIHADVKVTGGLGRRHARAVCRPRDGQCVGAVSAMRPLVRRVRRAVITNRRSAVGEGATRGHVHVRVSRKGSNADDNVRVLIVQREDKILVLALFDIVAKRNAGLQQHEVVGRRCRQRKRRRSHSIAVHANDVAALRTHVLRAKGDAHRLARQRVRGRPHEILNGVGIGVLPRAAIGIVPICTPAVALVPAPVAILRSATKVDVEADCPLKRSARKCQRAREVVDDELVVREAARRHGTRLWLPNHQALHRLPGPGAHVRHKRERRVRPPTHANVPLALLCVVDNDAVVSIVERGDRIGRFGRRVVLSVGHVQIRVAADHRARDLERVSALRHVELEVLVLVVLDKVTDGHAVLERAQGVAARRSDGKRRRLIAVNRDADEAAGAHVRGLDEHKVFAARELRAVGVLRARRNAALGVHVQVRVAEYRREGDGHFPGRCTHLKLVEFVGAGDDGALLRRAVNKERRTAVIHRSQNRKGAVAEAEDGNVERSTIRAGSRRGARARRIVVRHKDRVMAPVLRLPLEVPGFAAGCASCVARRLQGAVNEHVRVAVQRGDINRNVLRWVVDMKLEVEVLTRPNGRSLRNSVTKANNGTFGVRDNAVLGICSAEHLDVVLPCLGQEAIVAGTDDHRLRGKPVVRGRPLEVVRPGNIGRRPARLTRHVQADVTLLRRHGHRDAFVSCAGREQVVVASAVCEDAALLRLAVGEGDVGVQLRDNRERCGVAIPVDADEVRRVVLGGVGRLRDRDCVAAPRLALPLVNLLCRALVGAWLHAVRNNQIGVARQRRDDDRQGAGVRVRRRHRELEIVVLRRADAVAGRNAVGKLGEAVLRRGHQAVQGRCVPDDVDVDSARCTCTRRQVRCWDAQHVPLAARDRRVGRRLRRRRTAVDGEVQIRVPEVDRHAQDEVCGLGCCHCEVL